MRDACIALFPARACSRVAHSPIGAQTFFTCVARRMPCAYPIVEATTEQGRAQVTRRQGEGFRILTVNISRPGAGVP